MARISGLSDELLVKILSFLSTKEAVSTSVLSKKWEFLWMWLPKLEFDDKDYNDFTHINRSDQSSWLMYRDFIAKNLPLHRAPTIQSLRLRFCYGLLQPEDLKTWVGIAVSRCVCKISIGYFRFNFESPVLLSSSLYTCKSLVTLKLRGRMILVDVPRTVRLPCLKTLKLGCVTYSEEGSLQLLLSNCPVLEDLSIERDHEGDKVKAIVVIARSLLRLSLDIFKTCPCDEYVIVTPALKYLQVKDFRYDISYLIDDIPYLEEADIAVFRDPLDFLESVTSVKRLSLRVTWNGPVDTVYSSDTVFSQLENLQLNICEEDWSKLLVQLLKDSPNLRVLNIFVDADPHEFGDPRPVRWKNNKSSVPKCLMKILETFEFEGYTGLQEERDFLSYIFKHASFLKSSSILRGPSCYADQSPQ